MSGSIQSKNYVPGVSGWKLDQATGTFEINGLPRERSNTVIKDGKLVISTNGAPQVVLGNLPDLRDAQELKPFIVVDGVTYIRQGFIDDATVTKALITQECSAHNSRFRYECQDIRARSTNFAASLTLTNGPHSAGLSSFRLHHTHCSELGVLCEPIPIARPKAANLYRWSEDGSY